MNLGDYKLVPSNSKLASIPQELQLAHLLINQVADAAFCLQENSEFLYVNDAICRITEYSRQELLGMRLEDVDVDFSPEVWLEQWLLLKSQGSLSLKSRYRTKKGQMFLMGINLNYIEHQGKGIACVMGSDRSQEIVEFSMQRYADKSKDANQQLHEEVSAEYQQKEEELKTSVNLLRSTLESTANGILAVNFDGEILCYNQKFTDMWQLPKSITISRKCKRAKAFFESQVKDPQLFSDCVWEMEIQCNNERYDLLELKDGRTFAHYSEPQRLDEKIIGRVWSIWDVTEFKRTEAALKLNESRFRILAETTDASVFLIQNSKICYVNQAAETLTGYTKEELLNDFNLNRLITSKKLRQVNKLDDASACEYQEMQIVTKNGLQRWLACTVEMMDGLLDFSGKAVEFVTAIDITDYKSAESEVRQALEQAKKLSELRERFVSMLCHQFRTPLNIVSFSSDLLKRHFPQWNEDKIRSYLDLIQAAVHEISQLLDEVLLFGKAEAAKLECNPRPVDLQQFCRDIIAQMHLATDKQTSIDFISLSACSTAYLDPKLLHHILTNLLSNAIKYSPQGSTVIFELCCQDEEVIFQVQDAGIGIPVVDRQQIFEAFYRGSNVDSISGTGLGLSIVKTLVEIHGGRIAVESDVGAGTKFTVVLPNTIAES
jgi:PAS domain S-box-containing protein